MTHLILIDKLNVCTDTKAKCDGTDFGHIKFNFDFYRNAIQNRLHVNARSKQIKKKEKIKFDMADDHILEDDVSVSPFIDHELLQKVLSDFGKQYNQFVHDN